MKRHRPILFIFLFILQSGFLLYEQNAASDRSLEFKNVELKQLMDEGLPKNQALAVISVVSFAEMRAASAARMANTTVAFTSFMMILLIAISISEEKSQTSGGD